MLKEKKVEEWKESKRGTLKGFQMDFFVMQKRKQGGTQYGFINKAI